MNLLKKKRKIAIGFGVFLSLMAVGTLISKGIYATGLPQIDAAAPVNIRIAHEIAAEGSIKQGKETALHVAGGLRVESLYVRVGDKIKIGDILFDIDEEDLLEQITTQEREIQKINLQIADIQKNVQLSNQEKALIRSRAEEDYKNAEEKLNKEINDTMGEQQVHQEDSVAATSTQERQNKENAHQEWQRKKGELEQALAKAQKEKNQSEAVRTQAMGALNEAEKAKEEKPTEEPTEETTTEEATTEVATADKATDEELAQLKKALQDAEKVNYEKEQALTDAQYNLSVHSAKSVAKPDYSAEDMAQENWKTLEEQMENDLKDKEAEKAETLKSARRELEDAAQEANADSLEQIYKLELAEKTDTLRKLKEVMSSDGKICSEEDGMVTAFPVAVGERTTDGPAAKIADLSQQFEFTAVIQPEQKKYMNQGDSVKITLSGASSFVEGKIDYLTESEVLEGAYEATVLLPQGSGIIGQNGTLSVSAQSPGYPVCIPTDAVHKDSNGKDYVYIVSRKENILGSELAVRKIHVYVIDKNDRYAAIAEGMVDGKTQVVVSATKELHDGATVRFAEW